MAPPLEGFPVMPDAAPSAPPTPLAELYRHVWAHARGALARMAAAMALLGSSQVLKLAMPWMAAQAIDTLQTGGAAGLPPAGGWIAAIVALNLGVWLLHGPARVMERSVALRVRRSVADALYVRLSHAPLGWHERHHSGDLQHRVHQASDALCGFTQSQFIYLQSFINLAGPLVAMLLLSRTTGGLAIAGFVLTGLAIVRFDGALMHLAERENHAERRWARPCVPGHLHRGRRAPAGPAASLRPRGVHGGRRRHGGRAQRAPAGVRGDVPRGGRRGAAGAGRGGLSAGAEGGSGASAR
jgi:ATP-binding cassette subfamily B protein